MQKQFNRSLFKLRFQRMMGFCSFDAATRTTLPPSSNITTSDLHSYIGNKMTGVWAVDVDPLIFRPNIAIDMHYVAVHA